MVSESSTSLPDRVIHLRELLRTAKDFLVPWSYFHDELAMRADFVNAGRPSASPLIDAAIDRVAQQRGWRPTSGVEVTIHLADLEFWHGFRSLGDRTGIFFYDENTCQGLLGVMTDFAGPIDLFRLTTVRLPTTS